MKILGYNYKVVADEEIDKNAAGKVSFQTQIIQICPTICDEQKVSTLLHEIIEVLNYHNGWKLEHSIIMSLEATLYQALTEGGIDLSPLAKNIESKDKTVVPSNSEITHLEKQCQRRD
jgi:hypothetical protein